MPPTLYVLLFCFPHLISAGPQKTHPGNNLTDQLIAGTNSFIPSALNGLATVVEAGFESTEDEEHDDSDNGGETWQLEQFGGKWLIDGFETFSRILPLEREESNSAPIPVYGSSDRGQNMGRFDAAESPTGLEETDDHLQQQLEQ
ncbi:unnamed protein product, partial [Gongylonema pulchrum]|uniref:Secreted protein n=1 Tax=Gongylonema pulchrum TaxID=637853 RepID=A0A183DD67_9BILA